MNENDRQEKKKKKTLGWCKKEKEALKRIQHDKNNYMVIN